MEETKKSTDQKDQQQAGTDNIQGRLDNTANPNFAAQEDEGDISSIDRQEGTMDNGTLGGNFDNNSQDKE